MAKTFLSLFIFSGFMLLSGCATAEESKPPVRYPLETVEISIVYHPGRLLPGGYKINIDGNGKASCLTKKGGETLNLQDRNIIELLNDFYRVHFFDLPDTYTVKKQVSLLDDHSVSTFAERLVDISSKQICIKLSSYKKCITIVENRPVEVNRVAEKIKSLFTKHACHS